MRKKWTWIVPLTLLILMLPLLIESSYFMHITILAMIYIILATSLNLLSGYTGLLSLGHHAFYGIGAYTAALSVMRLGLPFLLALLLSGILPMILSYLVGKITFRLRSSFFAISTIAFAEITRLVSINWVELTEGPMGLPNIPAASIGPLVLNSYNKQYYLVLILAVSSIFLSYRIVNSHIGRVFKGIKDAEYVAISTGVNIDRYLMIAIMAGAFMAGIAGGFYGQYMKFISPDVFYFQMTVNMVVMVIAGGLGTIGGPVVGAIIFTLAPEVLRFSEGYSFILYGIALILIILFLPGGLWSLLKKVKNLFKNSVYPNNSEIEGSDNLK